MKIKIIDLLNKIANGKEMPKTIRWYDKFYNDYDEISNNYKAFVYEKLKNEVWNLNDEVEIIEEQKKIKKLDLNYKDIIYGTDFKEQILSYCDNLQYKINELIDEINNLKEND